MSSAGGQLTTCHSEGSGWPDIVNPPESGLRRHATVRSRDPCLRLALESVLAQAGVPPADPNHIADYLVTDDPSAAGPNVIYVVGDEPLDCRAAVDALLQRRVAAVVSRNDPQQARAVVRAVQEGLVVLPIRVLDAAGRAPELSPRQQQILPLIRAGLSNTQIASKVNASLATVKRDVSALLAASGSRSRLDLAVMATRRQPTGLTS